MFSAVESTGPAIGFRYTEKARTIRGCDETNILFGAGTYYYYNKYRGGENKNDMVRSKDTQRGSVLSGRVRLRRTLQLLLLCVFTIATGCACASFSAGGSSRHGVMIILRVRRRRRRRRRTRTLYTGLRASRLNAGEVVFLPVALCTAAYRARGAAVCRSVGGRGGEGRRRSRGQWTVGLGVAARPDTIPPPPLTR